MPPLSGTRPRLTNIAPSLARSEAMRKSHISAAESAPPSAWPLSAPITGLRQRHSTHCSLPPIESGSSRVPRSNSGP